ncbi:MAG TPA: hypothetical protein VMG10_02985 [Gemmataceae bacterium]|nr:hypothetical protein [Gemmataceae bacterium]
MTHDLKIGDRVRVTTASRVPGHPPGEEGTVLVGPILRGGGKPYYIVAIDKASTSTTSSIFAADEIEPAV